MQWLLQNIFVTHLQISQSLWFLTARSNSLDHFLRLLAWGIGLYLPLCCSTVLYIHVYCICKKCIISTKLQFQWSICFGFQAERKHTSVVTLATQLLSLHIPEAFLLSTISPREKHVCKRAVSCSSVRQTLKSCRLKVHKHEIFFIFCKKQIFMVPTKFWKK